MLDPVVFGKKLTQIGIRFYSGVPCSLLKPLINYAMSEVNYLPAANEGDAVAHCAGAWMGGQKSVVLLQNSGLGNTVSPLTSLNYTFDIPVLGFISLRGDPEIKDEPQHELMGQITCQLLDTLKIAWEILSDDPDTANKQIENANEYLEQRKSFFFVVKKSTFADYPAPSLKQFPAKPPSSIHRHPESLAKPLRIDALDVIKHRAQHQDDIVLLATTGITGRELYELGHESNQFYMVGSMGCVSAIAIGLALAKPNLKVVAIDGDGALLMRMGNLATLGTLAPKNLCHILLDNGTHESTGGQETVATQLDFPSLASAAGYEHVIRSSTPNQLLDSLDSWIHNPATSFIHLPIQTCHDKNLGRPSEKPRILLDQLIHRIAKIED